MGCTRIMTDDIDFSRFPITRYQGSKRRLLPWLYEHFNELNFHSALDLCGGTSVVSYLFKKMGKEVTYNDILKFNYWIGTALIENSNIRLSENDISFLLKQHDDIVYTDFIQDTFKDVYYLDKENKFLDIIIKNIQALENHYDDKKIAIYKQALAYYSLFQSCVIKRPFNLFHRKNLHLRINDVKRNFGNKATWDRSFEHYFIKFALEANRLIFDNGKNNKSLSYDALEFPNNSYDLVYLDPPYIPKRNVRNMCNYYKYYHFLEGIINYDNWSKLINFQLNYRPLIDNGHNWNHENGNIKGFEKIIEDFQDSVLVISYKEPGLPTIKQLKTIIHQFKNTHINIYKTPHFYALNKNNGHYKEVLIVAK